MVFASFHLYVEQFHLLAHLALCARISSTVRLLAFLANRAEFGAGGFAGVLKSRELCRLVLHVLSEQNK